MRPLHRLCLLALAGPFALGLLPLSASAALAQGAPDDDTGPGIRFNGLGRTYIQQTELGGDVLAIDTASVESLTDGEFLLDLAVNGQPNDVTEVQGVVRLRNEFGGFFGAGVTVELRELWARGIIADVLAYRVGDMDVALTPYTLFLPDEDGTVNEPELFRPQKEVIYYEEFYTGFNTRRLQGARLDFGLEFEEGLEATDVRAFVARLRGTNFADQPTRLIAGGRVGATSMPFGPYGSQARAGVNLSYTWDDLDSGDANEGIRNPVVSVDTDVTLFQRDAFDVRLVGEAGRSMITLKEVLEVPVENPSGDPMEETFTTRDTTYFEEDDTFVEVGLAAGLPEIGLAASATFVDVGPDFYSASAQSKRVDYTRPRSVYNRIGNDRDLRRVSLFDLSRDPAVYTFRVANQLMAYDPRYNNVLPYGRATPNRRGVRLDAAYEPDAAFFEAELTTAFLREIRGQGTTELKDFFLARLGTDVFIDRIVGWDRALGATLGLQVETTDRAGNEFEVVDLSSPLFEAGISAEVYPRLDVLLGGKWRASSGSDYVPLFENFNDIRDFPQRFETDDRESLLGAGLRYRFSPGIYLTVQAQRFSYRDDATPADDYTLGQVFALYSMSF